MKRLLAMLLVLALVLTGCSVPTVRDLLTADYADMTYTRPDLDELDRVLEQSCATAAAGISIQDVEDGIWDFYDLYDGYYTNYYLAYLNYCHDVTDIYWQKEYRWCAENATAVDAALEELYQALAASPQRKTLETAEYFGAGYFDDYEGESFYDPTLVALLEQESDLVNRYYDLYAEATAKTDSTDAFYDAHAESLCQILIDLVKVRRDVAEYAGYLDYATFCYEYYHYRDYSWRTAQSLLDEIRTELVPLYRQISDDELWNTGYRDCNEAEAYEYLRATAQAMGGTVAAAFERLDAAGLYDIKYGANKYDASFEVYLTSYNSPFIFMNPSLTRWDKLTLVHEFGHFANDYAVYGGSYAGRDVEEFFSQGLEYLSLYYGSDPELERLKVADCLSTYVEQAAFATFEHRLYQLPEAELTTDTVFALYEEVGRAYAFDAIDWDPRDLVTVTHFYTDPMYIVSYVVSNDAAFQLYQLEKSESGAGLKLYESQLGTDEGYLLTFVKTAGLDSPFTPGRIQTVRETLEEILG